MNLTHILAFHRVATAGGFTSAATLCGISQPTLSAQVRQLERTAGHALFERGGRRIRLTPAGERLYEATRRLAAALDEVEAVIAGSRKAARGSLRVTADSANHVLPVLARLKQSTGGLKFSIRISNSAEVIQQILTDAADVGVTARNPADPRLHALRIRDDRLVVTLASADPLASRKRIRLEELESRDLVVRETGSITREVADRALAQAGIVKGQILEVATREAVREAVAAGFGYGLVFASEAGPDARIAALPIAGANVAVAEFAICRAERRGLGIVARFLDAAQKVAADSGWLTRKKR